MTQGLTLNHDRNGLWLAADHELLWNGPATAPSGGFTDRVNFDFKRQQMWARVKLAKHVETDDGYSGFVFKTVIDDLPLTDEHLARYGLRLIVKDGDPVGVEWMGY